MRLVYDATLDDHVHASFRHFETSGEATTFFRFGVLLTPVVLLFPALTTSNKSLGFQVGLAAALLYLVVFLLRYQSFLRRRFRRMTIKALGGEGPFAAEVETDAEGITSSSQGQQIKFLWNSLVQVADTDDGIELLFAPSGVLVLPPHAFADDGERTSWLAHLQTYTAGEAA